MGTKSVRSLFFLLDGVRSVAATMQKASQNPPLWLYGAHAIVALPIQLALYGCVRVVSAINTPLAVKAKTRYGSEMICCLPDGIQTCIFLYGVWEPDISAFIASELHPGDTFIDVGAHVGYHSVLASRAVGCDGNVVALEASPETFAVLENNLSLNPDCRNVRALNVAASERTGMIPFYLGPKGLGIEGWSTTVLRDSFRQRCTVSAGPLSSLLTEKELQTAKIIKIDVEGAEAEVLRGLVPSLGLLRQDVQLVIELSPSLWPAASREQNMTCEQVLSPLLDAGFRPYHIKNNYAPWRFLYPERISRPVQIRGPIRVSSVTGQIDLVLSKKDADRL
ncbi:MULTISPECIES: FkbM family methyltransferase [unclassified Microcoleus]|uniref:FkbM family methyltransferase n=1 Tax=unclassified Microcoleus TaxID=2642155 RepID=UPI002FD1C79A